STRLRSAPPELTQWDRVRSHRHPLHGEIRRDRECANCRRPEVEGKCQVDRGVSENENEGRCSRPSQVASERKVGESESRNDQKRQVVHVLMWAQDQRSRDRQGEIESRLVWPPRSEGRRVGKG